MHVAHIHSGECVLFAYIAFLLHFNHYSFILLIYVLENTLTQENILNFSWCQPEFYWSCFSTRKPYAYATRFFSSAVKNLSQIVKEAVAVQFGCKKFHFFIFGKKVLMETDHQPLETIFERTLREAPVCLQKIFLQLMSYNPKIVYIKGKNMLCA